MLQPFGLYHTDYTKRFLDLNKIFLVSQTYTRGPEQTGKINILVTDYDDIGLANIHYAAVRNDIYASVIHLDNVKHAATLSQMLEPHSSYTVYWAVVPDKQKLKQRIDLKFKKRIRLWILANTAWKIAAGATLKTVIQVIFGELFITLYYGSESIRIKFEEIEKS